jgi:hypothetical protein
LSPHDYHQDKFLGVFSNARPFCPLDQSKNSHGFVDFNASGQALSLSCFLNVSLLNPPGAKAALTINARSGLSDSLSIRRGFRGWPWCHDGERCEGEGLAMLELINMMKFWNRQELSALYYMEL